MEPMVTGSPTFYDAVSNTSGVNATPSRSFLPGYLMGNHRNRQDIHSPASNTACNERSLAMPSSTMSPSVRPSNLKVTWSPLLDRTNYYEPNNSTAHFQQEDAENYYNMTPKRSAATVDSFSATPGASGPPTATFMESFSTKGVLNGSTIGVGQNTPGLKATQSSGISSDVDENLKIVTIFGFIVESIPFILQHFSQCGTIIAHETANKCNWIHVKFESKLQASKAIARNGRILNETLKIGVEQCRDEKAIKHLNERTMNRGTNTNLLNSTISSPPPNSVYDAFTSVREPWNTPKSALSQNQPRTNMRSLIAYNGPSQREYHIQSNTFHLKNRLLIE